jgi:alpha-glucosidase
MSKEDIIAGRAGRMLRVVVGAPSFPDVPFFVAEPPKFVRDDAVVAVSGDHVTLKDGERHVLSFAGAHAPFRLDVHTGDATILGFGAANGAPTRNGARFRLMTLDTLFFGIEGASYTSMPFFLVKKGNELTGVLVATTFPLDVEVVDGKVSFRAASDTEDTPLDVVVLRGAPQEILQDLTSLVGRTYLPPAWALGFHQSRWSYKTQGDVLDVARRFRAEDLPADVVHLDIHYMDNYRVFTFSPERFPQPKKLHEELSSLGFRTMAIVDPGVSVTPGYHVYEDGKAKDLYLKRKDGSAYEGKVWPGATVFPDFGLEKVREAWAGYHATLVDAGVSGVWNDMNDPVFKVGKVYDPLLEDVRHANGSHARWRGLYANQMAMATQAGFKKLRPGVRPFVLTRSGFLGIQRHAAVWTGDNSSTWEQLEENLHMVLNLGVSGVPITGADVGGFGGRRGVLGMAKLRPPVELFIRWMELGHVMPFFRVHSVLYAPTQEPYRFGKRGTELSRKLLRRRYRLLPYLYRLVLEAHETGAPIARPTWFHASVPRARDALAMEQFFLGESILVAPVLHKGMTKREVWLPPGPWVDFETGEILVGDAVEGRVFTREAPLGSPPMFLRAGDAIFGSPARRNVDESMRAGLTLEVSAPPPGRVGRGSLFLDDGEHDAPAPWVLDVTVEDLGGRLRLRLQPRTSAPQSFHSEVELRVPKAFTTALVDGAEVPLHKLDLASEDRKLVVSAGRVPLTAKEIILT